MKKIIITAISAIAVIASVVGCQIYDSQENTVLYSAMNAQGEGITSFESYAKTFDEICVDLSNDDNTSDFLAIFDMFFSYDEFVTAVKGLIADDTSFTGDSTKSIFNVEDLKEHCKKTLISKAETRAVIIAGYASDVDSAKMALFPTIGSYTLSGMYEKQYQLKWDYNSKKGR